MMLRASIPPPLAAALAATLAALLLAAFSLWRAVKLESAVRPGPEQSPVTVLPQQAGARNAKGDSLVGVTVMHDPFRPERRPPPSRFRMPGEPAEPTGSAHVDAGDVRLRLVGTAVSLGGRDFAVCQAGADPPKLVHVGQELNGFTLLRVNKERAVFRDSSGTTIELVVPGAEI